MNLLCRNQHVKRHQGIFFDGFWLLISAWAWLLLLIVMVAIVTTKKPESWNYAIIPPGTDQGLLFIQLLFISADLKPDMMYLLALCVKTDNLWEFMAHQRLPLASQTQTNLLYAQKCKFPDCRCLGFTAASAKTRFTSVCTKKERANKQRQRFTTVFV